MHSMSPELPSTQRKVHPLLFVLSLVLFVSTFPGTDAAAGWGCLSQVGDNTSGSGVGLPSVFLLSFQTGGRANEAAVIAGS